MTAFDDWWANIRLKNNWPHDAPDDQRVTFRMSHLRNLLQNTHHDGFKSGVKFAKEHQDRDDPMRKLNDLFGGKFG